MKVSVIFAALVASLLITVSFGEDQVSVKSWDLGVDCGNVSGVACTSKKGYFTGVTSSFRHITSTTPTNVYIHITNIKASNPDAQMVYVCPVGRMCNIVSTSEDKVLIYKNVISISVYATTYVEEFHLQYIMGCEIVDDPTGVEIDHQSENPWEGQHCWIIIPRLYSSSQKQYTAHTYGILTDVQLPPSSTIGVYSLLTIGRKWFVTNDESLYFNIVPTTTPTSFQRNREISSVVLFEVNSCEPYCNSVGFKLQMTAMSEHDMKCIEKKQLCEFNIGSKCNDTNFKCEAYDKLQLQVIQSDDTESHDDSDTSRANKTKSCSMKKYAGAPWKSPFCYTYKKSGKKPNCKRFFPCVMQCNMYRALDRCNTKSTSNRIMF